MDDVKEPTVGRIVHYHTKEGPRPAIVVQPWGDGLVNLQVFLDGSNDRENGIETQDGLQRFTEAECQRGLAWATSVSHGEAQGYWSWPPRV